MAEGILRKRLQEKNLAIELDSAGTGTYHIGECPDKRAIQTAKKFGVDISKLVARQFRSSDFETFDRIYVMDQSNYHDVLSISRNEEDEKKVDLFLNVMEGEKGMEVPDPWFGGMDGFESVFHLLDRASIELANQLSKK